MNTKIIFKKQSGFTLIELLVVIAIIGILSSVVLASVSNSRQKAKDASVKADLSVVMKQAELYLLNNNTYGIYANACPTTTQATTIMFGDPTLYKALTQALANAGGTYASRCYSNATSWVVAVSLKSGGSWCVDGMGISKKVASTPVGSVFATSPYKCK